MLHWGYKHGNQETAGIQLWYCVKVFKLNNNSCMHDHEELDSLSFWFSSIRQIQRIMKAKRVHSRRQESPLTDVIPAITVI